MCVLIEAFGFMLITGVQVIKVWKGEISAWNFHDDGTNRFENWQELFQNCALSLEWSFKIDKEAV